MAEPICKLTYKIMKRRTQTVRRVPGINSGWQAGPASPGTHMQPDLEIDQVDVEWEHADGFPADTVERVVSLEDARTIVYEVLKQAVADGVIEPVAVPDVMKVISKVVVEKEFLPGRGIVTVSDGVRRVIKDQINVPAGSSTAAVQMLLEEKRHALAKALKIEP